MASKNSSTIWFIGGLFALALIVGILTGVSASPVVAVIIPAVFGLFSVADVMVKGHRGNSDPEAMVDVRANAGRQLVTFAVAFIVGLWLGVAAKLNPSSFWPTRREPPAAFSLSYQHPLDLRIAMALDAEMQRSGVSLARRQAILREMAKVQAIARKDDVGELSYRDTDAAKIILGVPAQTSAGPLIPVAHAPKDWSVTSGQS